MLNFIYYPVSAIMWFWHKVFGFVLGEANGFAWALSVVFLVLTLRAILYRPFVGQIRSMRKMQEMQPEMQRLKKKYGNNFQQKMTPEQQKAMQKSSLGGCLPILVQLPVFIGLFHVLREFKPGKLENYVFNAQEVQSFVDSNLLGSKLGAAIFPLASFGGQGIPSVQELGGNLVNQWIVMIPLMIAAGVFTHITSRHSVQRQKDAQLLADTSGKDAAPATPGLGKQQTEIMQKLMLYVFPIGVVVGAPFLPLAILFYWVSNNLWTLGQQYIVYKKIDTEEAVAREAAKDKASERDAAGQQQRKQKERELAARKKGKGGGAANASGSTAPGTDGEAPDAEDLDDELTPSGKIPGSKPMSKKTRRDRAEQDGAVDGDSVDGTTSESPVADSGTTASDSAEKAPDVVADPADQHRNGAEPETGEQSAAAGTAPPDDGEDPAGSGSDGGAGAAAETNGTSPGGGKHGSSSRSGGYGRNRSGGGRSKQASKRKPGSPTSGKNKSGSKR